MPGDALLNRLATVYLGENIRYPTLRPVTFAQWMLESGRATSKLARDHYNFGGLKWRPEMAGFATRIKFEAHDGVDFYCKFATIESFIRGYWAFIDRAPYSGWEQHVSSPEDFIGFIGPIYTPSRNYARRVLNLVPNADQILADARSAGPGSTTTGTTRLGTIVIDPGHGGTAQMPGSSANNAISASGVKEKKLTLDFCSILRDELTRQASAANEEVKVVLTRTTDINMPGSKRAGMAFENRAKLFLSLHFNGGPERTRGCETFFRAAKNGALNFIADKAFAEAINTAVFSSLAAIDSSAKDRGVK
jgi:N-acetylmuramoyl-L-alanine amidase